MSLPSDAAVTNGPLCRDGHVARTENSEISELRRRKNILKTFFISKLLQIRRELVVSFLEHILDRSDSYSKYQNFSDNRGGKSEISRISDGIEHQIVRSQWNRVHTR